MTLQIRGYAAQSASTPLTAHRFERRAPRADDLVIDILYCGVCHSDLHQARNEWHNSLYPLVPAAWSTPAGTAPPAPRAWSSIARNTRP